MGMSDILGSNSREENQLIFWRNQASDAYIMRDVLSNQLSAAQAEIVRLEKLNDNLITENKRLEAGYCGDRKYASVQDALPENWRAQFNRKERALKRVLVVMKAERQAAERDIQHLVTAFDCHDSVMICEICEHSCDDDCPGSECLTNCFEWRGYEKGATENE